MPRQILLAAGLVATMTACQAGTREQPMRVAIDTSIDLPAPVHVVWAALTDTAAYPDWNPYHVRVAGNLAVGEGLTVDIVKPNGHALTIHPRVLEMQTNRSLVWGGGPWGLFRGEHRFDLEQLSPHCTRLLHTEVFAGIFVSFADLDAIEPGYVSMNEALRDRLAAAGHDKDALC